MRLNFDLTQGRDQPYRKELHFAIVTEKLSQELNEHSTRKEQIRAGRKST